MGLNVLGRSCNGILRLRLEAESNDPIGRGPRHERGLLCADWRPSDVVDLHRVNGGRLVAGPAGVLMVIARCVMRQVWHWDLRRILDDSSFFQIFQKTAWL